MAKSADAFRTISEVSEWLDTPAHVLRFWESKFTQVKPVKRAGGRRYYRPSDMELLGGIKRLLHDDGMTIKGVQKLLREKGVAHVAALSQPLDELTAAVRDALDTKARAREAAAVEVPDAEEVAEEAAPAVETSPHGETTPQIETTPPVESAPHVDPAPPPAETPAPDTTVVQMPLSASPLPSPVPSAVPSVAGPAEAPSGPEVADEAVEPEKEPESLLALIHARRAPLPDGVAAEVAALQNKLALWAARPLV